MNLSELLFAADLVSSIPASVLSSPVSQITADSREVLKGAAFFCIVGAKVDARTFIKDAFDKGALAVIHDCELSEKYAGLTIKVKEIRKALSYAASKFFGEPSKKLTNVAITGTSGKTSVAWILSHALQLLDSQTFIGGTLGYKLLENVGSEATKGIKEALNTSMDPISVHRFLSDAVKKGAKSSVMEATSQGILQSRMRDVAWNGAIFTNLSREHMDLHGTMEEYEAAKRELFVTDLINSPKENKFAIFNFDDAAGKRIGSELKQKNLGIKVLSFSKENSSEVDYIISNLKADTAGLSFTLKTKSETINLSSPLVGSHNAENMTCAALALRSLGYSPEQISSTIANVPTIPGRLEPLHGKGVAVYVDYAHKPDALEKILIFLRPLCKGKLITVMGCGGDRDKGKRPLMGEISTRLSDLTVVTSDNPRTEDPQTIINEILTGIKNKNDSVIVEIDRKKAINQAIDQAKAGDIVLIAGKGHEPYQEINGIKHPFYDVQVVKDALS